LDYAGMIGKMETIDGHEVERMKNYDAQCECKSRRPTPFEDLNKTTKPTEIKSNFYY